MFNREKPELFPESIEGIVEESISSNQRGRVKCDGTYWPAQMYEADCQLPLLPQQTICVVGRIGITLLVKPK